MFSAQTALFLDSQTLTYNLITDQHKCVLCSLSTFAFNELPKDSNVSLHIMNSDMHSHAFLSHKQLTDLSKVHFLK